MATSSFDDTALDVGEEDLPPTNDVAATRPYDEPNISTDEFWNKDFSEQDEIFARLVQRRRSAGSGRSKPPCPRTRTTLVSGQWCATTTSLRSASAAISSCHATACILISFRGSTRSWPNRFWPWTIPNTTGCAG